MDIVTQQIVIEELECPICIDIMRPPIRQCINFHAICNHCFKKVIICPMCRQAKSRKRSETQELLFSKTTIPCRYKPDGCCFSAKGDDLKDHEGRCLYSPRSCPVMDPENCNWRGTLLDVVSHCNSQHLGRIYFRDEALLEVLGFKQDTLSRKYLTIFFVYDLAFRFYWDVNLVTSQVRFSVTYMGSSSKRSQFRYKIGLLDDDSCKVSVIIKGICVFTRKDAEYIPGESYEAISHDILKNLCTPEGDLRYCIKIMKNMEKSVASASDLI